MRAEMRELLTFVMEGRKRVKDNLMRIDSTYDPVDFWFEDLESGEKTYVQTLEEKEFPEIYKSVRSVECRVRSEETNSDSSEATLTLRQPQELRNVSEASEKSELKTDAAQNLVNLVEKEPAAKEGAVTVSENQTGIDFEMLFAKHITGTKEILIVDPFIRKFHQARNMMDLLSVVLKEKAREDEVSVKLRTAKDDIDPNAQEKYLEQIFDAYAPEGIVFTWEFLDNLHDRWIDTDTGWHIIMGRGLDIFQQLDGRNAFYIQNFVPSRRQCKAFSVTYVNIDGATDFLIEYMAMEVVDNYGEVGVNTTLKENRRGALLCKRFVFLMSFLGASTLFALPNDARRDECVRQAQHLVDALSAEERLSQLMMDSPAIDRLGIPKYHWWNEALHGDARAGLATVFPQSIGMAATFDEKLMLRVGDIVSTEARAKYNLFSSKGFRDIYFGLTLWSPNVNMFRDPRWGRGQETFGEDPFLSGRMGGAYVRGLQGDDPRYLKTAACAKHFAVHSGPEALRHGFDVKVSVRDLAEYYLPAFKVLAEDAKVEAFMGAYSAVNGTPCCANRWLLTDLLRGEWGFRGHVVSDAGAVRDIISGHHFITNEVAACRAAIAAGLDLCSGKSYGCLAAALRSGAVSAEELAVPLRRLYATRALLGQFDPPGSTPWDKLGAEDVATAANRAVALEAAEKSLVLISNNGVLPLDVSRQSCIAVVGPRACDEIALVGNYCGFSDAPVSCMSGFLRAVGPGVKVETGAEAFSWGTDFAVACLGITAEDEGEDGCSVNNRSGDRASYGLPPSQIELLKRLRRRFKRVVTVVFGGSPFDLKPVCELSDAVMLAWYPGEQGGLAVARAVLGQVNPSGRLPITMPRSYDDLPNFKDYSLAGRTYRYATKAPLYPFGYGLSYTQFSYANAEVAVEGRGSSRKVMVSVRVKNTGKVAGDEVVQVYVRAPAASGDRRLHHLENFSRIRLEPGESKALTFALPQSAFVVYDEEGRAYLPQGKSTVFVGGGQPGFAQCQSVAVAL